MLAPLDGAFTSLPSHPALCCCSPPSMGDSVIAATVGVSHTRKPLISRETREGAVHVMHTLTSAQAPQQNRRPEKAPRNIHSTSALPTAHLTLKTSAQGAQKRLSTSVPSCRRGATVVPHFHSPQRFSQRQCQILPVCVPQFLANRVRNYDLRLARLVIERVASHVSLSGVSYLPQRLGPAASTKMTDVDFLGHLLRTCGTTSPIPLPRRPCRRLGKWHANSGAVDERAQRTFLTFTKCQLAHPFLDGRVLENLLGELGSPPNSSPDRQSSPHRGWPPRPHSGSSTCSAPANLQRSCPQGCPRQSGVALSTTGAPALVEEMPFSSLPALHLRSRLHAVASIQSKPEMCLLHSVISIFHGFPKRLSAALAVVLFLLRWIWMRAQSFFFHVGSPALPTPSSAVVSQSTRASPRFETSGWTLPRCCSRCQASAALLSSALPDLWAQDVTPTSRRYLARLLWYV